MMVENLATNPDRGLPDHVALSPEELSDGAIEAIRTAVPSAEAKAADRYLEDGQGQADPLVVG